MGMCFFSTLIYFSVLPFREVPIVFLFTLGLFFFLKWVKESKIPYVFISQCFFALSMGLHTGMIWVITFPIFEVSYEIALALKTKNRSILVKKTFAFLIVLFIFLIVFSTGFGFEKMPNNTSNVISSLEEEQENAARDEQLSCRFRFKKYRYKLAGLAYYIFSFCSLYLDG